MNRDKQIQKVNDIYNKICCLLVYNDKFNLNNEINRIKREIDKLKL